MANAYLSTLVCEIDKTIDSCKNLNLFLDSFLQEFTFVDGVNAKISPSDILNVVKKNVEVEEKMLELRNLIISEGKENGREN